MGKIRDAYHSWQYGFNNARGFGEKVRATIYWAAEKFLRYLPARTYWNILGRIDPCMTVGLTCKPEDLYQSTNQVLQVLEDHRLISKDSITLHIGAGVGRIEYALASKVRKCYGIDISSVLTKVARRNLTIYDNVEFFVGDGRTLRFFQDDMFDVIYSTITFQHLPREVCSSYIAEAGRVLKPDGVLLFTVPAVPESQRVMVDRHDAHTIRRYTPLELRTMIADTEVLTTQKIINEETVGSVGQVEVWMLARKATAMENI